jgi:hypothetical protein
MYATYASFGLQAVLNLSEIFLTKYAPFSKLAGFAVAVASDGPSYSNFR